MGRIYNRNYGEINNLNSGTLDPSDEHCLSWKREKVWWIESSKIPSCTSRVHLTILIMMSLEIPCQKEDFLGPLFTRLRVCWPVDSDHTPRDASEWQASGRLSTGRYPFHAHVDLVVNKLLDSYRRERFFVYVDTISSNTDVSAYPCLRSYF